MPKELTKFERECRLATLENLGCDIRNLKTDREIMNMYDNWAGEFENVGGNIDEEYQYWVKHYTDLAKLGTPKADSDVEQPDVNPSGEKLSDQFVDRR